MGELPDKLSLLQVIIDRVSVGIVVVDRNHNVVLWNSFMENYSEVNTEDIIDKNLFDSFPDLPKNWLERKIQNVFVLKNFSFTSWEHRPYLFKFQHNRPITGGADYMRQNCTFLPIKGDSGDIEYVCITLFDATDISIYENMLKEAIKTLARVSNQDSLTGVYNRRYLELSLSREFNRAKRYGHPLSVVIFDLDHFKSINDTYGHMAGDEVLKEASKRINIALRDSDILGRYGGEEFVVILPETDLNSAHIIADRLREKLADEPIVYSKDVLFEKPEITVTASLGLTAMREDTLDYQTMLQEADSALYQSKEGGRNRTTKYEFVSDGSVSAPAVSAPAPAPAITAPKTQTIEDQVESEPVDVDSELKDVAFQETSELIQDGNVIYITIGHR
ncbi:MAG: diguanylate cyclase [Gammaproteobacteria bacterium]|nr:diguanylate cyclase [Gammaproteobacteria bacterium]